MAVDCGAKPQAHSCRGPVIQGSERKNSGEFYVVLLLYFQSVFFLAAYRPPIDPPELLSARHVSYVCITKASAPVGAAVFANVAPMTSSRVNSSGSSGASCCHT